MNRIKLLFLGVTFATSALAQPVANGYYRVQSTKQLRYISVVDNRGSVNLSTTSADMAALSTVQGFENVVSDPSSVVYFKWMTEGYDLQSQGTGSFAIISYEVRVFDNGGNTYCAYASRSGLTKYLMDETITWMTEDEDILRGHVMTKGSPEGNEADWNILPVKAGTDCYFGLKPTVSAGGSYYQTFYAAFPFTFNSAGMSAYAITTVDEGLGAAVITDVNGGVPASVPVIVKCTSSQANENQLNVGATTTGSAPGNLLKGVYFCNDVTNVGHRNVVNYDPATMRVLGTAPDGSLAFVKSSSLKYIPANTAYITVSASAPDVLKVCTQEEYNLMKAGKKGDVNGDGEVNVGDLVSVSNFMAGDTSVSKDKADVNKDGEVNVGDLVTISNIMAGNE